ncbi:MAG TPA: enoyl-CoA hydratase/isomerase family protein [Terriglobales bacterium]|jgi:enoyl-CoA hydratase/carnithine racemase
MTFLEADKQMILTIDHGNVRELRLNRPPANALSPELISTLRQAVESAPKEGARALILSGVPGMFSAGLDIPLLLTLGRHEISSLWGELYSLLRALAISEIPLAAALTGHAPAGGTVLGIYCDTRIVAHGDWRIGLSEVQVGLPLPPVILRALRRLVGPQQAERLATRGLLISPDEAACIGLVDELVPPDQVVPRALEWCQSLLAIPPSAMNFTRREARRDLAAIFTQNLEAEVEVMSSAWWNADTQAALHAMVDRLRTKKAG